jgi:hypothetical protein
MQPRQGQRKDIERTHKYKRNRTITVRRFMRENRYACRYNNLLSDYVNIEPNKMSQCQPTSVYKIKNEKKFHLRKNLAISTNDVP